MMKTFEIRYKVNDLVYATMEVCCHTSIDAEALFHTYCRGLIVGISEVQHG